MMQPKRPELGGLGVAYFNAPLHPTKRVKPRVRAKQRESLSQFVGRLERNRSDSTDVKFTAHLVGEPREQPQEQS